MRDAQTARPQTFRTGDGWFAYNLPRSKSEQPAPPKTPTPPNIPPLLHWETSIHRRSGLPPPLAPSEHPVLPCPRVRGETNPPGPAKE